jgi:hypothetical protein
MCSGPARLSPVSSEPSPRLVLVHAQEKTKNLGSGGECSSCFWRSLQRQVSELSYSNSSLFAVTNCVFRRPILKISTDVQYVQVLITYELEKSHGGGGERLEQYFA